MTAKLNTAALLLSWFALGAAPLAAQEQAAKTGKAPLTADGRTVAEWVAKLDGAGANPRARLAAIKALAMFGPDGKEAVPSLLRVLRSEDVELRLQAAAALWAIDQHEAALPAATGALLDPDGDHQAAKLLCRMKKHKDVLAAAEMLARSDDAGKQERAAWLFSACGREGIPALRELLKQHGALLKKRGVRFAIEGSASPAAVLAPCFSDKLADVRELALEALRDVREVDASSPEGSEIVAALKALLEDKKPAVCEQAAGCMARCGRTGLTILIERLSSADSTGKKHALAALRSMAFRQPPLADADRAAALAAAGKALQDSAAEVRRAAVEAIAALGGGLPEGVRWLTVALADRDDKVRTAALISWEKIGPKDAAAMPALRELLESGGESRYHAAQALATLGKVGAEALVAALGHESEKVRYSAVEALQKMPQESAAVLPALIGALNDRDRSVRWEAAKALQVFGPKAKDGVPAIIKLLGEENPFKDDRPYEALQSIGPEAKAAVPALMKALSDSHFYIRSHAAAALGRIGPTAKDALPALRKLLDDESAMVRTRAAEAIWRIAKDASVKKTLVETYRAGPTGLDLAPLEILLALGELGPEAKDAAPLLLEAVKPCRELDRAKLLEAVARMGDDQALKAVSILLEMPYMDYHLAQGDVGKRFLKPLGKKVVPALITALRSKNDVVRANAVAAMRTMKEDAAEAIPDLVQALRNDPRQWLAAPAILAGMGHGVVPELKKLMPSDDQEVSGDIEATMKRQFPLHVLGEMKPLSPETVAILLKVLEGKNDSDRGFAWSALGKNATDITPLLVRALRHENPRVRAGAAAALDYTRDVKSPEIVPALIESLRDTDVAARYRAAKALKRINPKAAQSAGAEAVIARHCGLEESD